VPDADLGCDLPVGDAIGGQQDDARPAQGLLAGGMSTRAAFQFGPSASVITSAGNLGIGGLRGIE